MTDGPRSLPPFTPRPHVWLEPGEPLVCPRGHRLKTNATLVEHAAFTCQHKATADTPECGAIIFVLRFPQGPRYLAEVTRAELREMLAKSMSLVETLNYLRSTRAA